MCPMKGCDYMIECKVNIEKDIYLMHKDIKVMQINIDENRYTILNEKYMPFNFRDAFLVHEVKDTYTEYDAIQIARCVRKNAARFTNWLSHRVLLLTQANAKRLYQAYRLVQRDDEGTKAKLALTYRALSILDNYWVKNLDDNASWEDVNLRNNSLSEAVTQIALHGRSLTLNGMPDPYAFSTNGAYAKAWHRDEDKSLWLYKAGYNNSEERIEVECSNILDRCNVAHCHYELRQDDDLRVCACPSMTSDEISIADGDVFSSYCNIHNLNVDKELVNLDPDGYYKMFIIDYLLANRDRHTQNWGIYYKNDTMEILGLHPLFDHNNAFEIDVMQNEDFESHFLNHTLKENAMYAMKQVDFHFTEPITRDLFLTDRQYKTFMSRAGQLGISVQTLTKDDLYVQYGGFQKYKDSVLSILPPSQRNAEISKDYIVSLKYALQAVQGTHNCYRID